MVLFNCCLTYTANIAVGVPVCSEWITNRAATECTWQAEMTGCTGMHGLTSRNFASKLVGNIFGLLSTLVCAFYWIKWKFLTLNTSLLYIWLVRCYAHLLQYQWAQCIFMLLTFYFHFCVWFLFQTFQNGKKLRLQPILRKKVTIPSWLEP